MSARERIHVSQSFLGDQCDHLCSLEYKRQWCHQMPIDIVCQYPIHCIFQLFPEGSSRGTRIGAKGKLWSGAARAFWVPGYEPAVDPGDAGRVRPYEEAKGRQCKTQLLLFIALVAGHCHSRIKWNWQRNVGMKLFRGGLTGFKAGVNYLPTVSGHRITWHLNLVFLTSFSPSAGSICNCHVFPHSEALHLVP